MAKKLAADQEANWLAVRQAAGRPEVPVQVLVGLLGAARAEWKAALIEGDKDVVEASRFKTFQRLGPWTPPALVDKFRELDAQSQRMGAPPLVEPAELDLVSGLQDRGGRRALLTGAAT